MIIIIIFINCNWVISRWQWLYYMYTNMEREKKVTRKKVTKMMMMMDNKQATKK